jgi:hypothetical protein
MNQKWFKELLRWLLFLLDGQDVIIQNGVDVQPNWPNICGSA